MSHLSDWYDIPGCPGYRINVEGVVLGLRGRPLKPWKQKRGGYPAVKICLPGKQVTKCVHSLMAATFLGEPEPGQEVCHKDGNPDNTHISNLYWGTRTNNVADMYRHGTWAKKRPTNTGELHTMAKLSEADVRTIIPLLVDHTNVELARRYNVSHYAISHIRTGRTWKHIER